MKALDKLYQKGVYALEFGKIDAARDCAHEILSLEAENALGLYLLARCAYDEGLFEEAETRARLAGSKAGSAPFLVAGALAMQGKDEEAIEAAEHAISTAGESITARHLTTVASIYFGADRRPQAKLRS